MSRVSAGYPVPARTHRVEDHVRRSRFVTIAGRASTDAMAHAFVESVRRELPDATHHCWAFVAGPPGSTSHIGMSDAGEPHGTAGRPMLAALLHSGVGEIVAVCSRWFGGVKLGTGGLARAYAQSVNHVLAALPTLQLVERTAVTLTVTYPDVDAVKLMAARHDALVEGEEYGEAVRFRLAVPAPEIDRLRRAIAELMQGRARWEGA